MGITYVMRLGSSIWQKKTFFQLILFTVYVMLCDTVVKNETVMRQYV